MSYKTIDAVEEAIEDTRELLLPFNLRTWAKLALIAALAGGAGGINFPGMPSGGADYSPEPRTDSSTSDLQSSQDNTDLSNLATGAFISSPRTAALAGVAVSLVSFLLFFMYVSSVFEFIYYKSLIDRDVKIIQNFKENTGKGFRLFSFRLFWTLGMVLTAGIAFLTVLWQPLFIVAILLLMLPLVIIVAVVNAFVNTFVVLRMLETGNGFIKSAKSAYQDVKREWKEFAIFVVMNIVLAMAIGIVVSIGAFTVLISLALPLGIVGILLYWVSWLLVVPVAVIGVLAFILVVLIGLVVPTSTFLYYYSIEVYNALTDQ
ncbi:MAG: hypothetical protein ACI9LV_000989 [Candidatus Nanohaloarchaea archaeon]|jgi:hypothetical protein